VFAHKAAAAIGSGQDWTYARCQDFLGSSSYPAWFPFHAWDDAYPRDNAPERHASLLAEMWSYVALNFDIIRSANRPGSPVWAAEFQGGPVSMGMHKGRVPSPDDIRRWMLTAVCSGVSAISFWVTRAEIAAGETNGFSLLDSAGDSTPRLEEAGRVGQALNRYADLFGVPSWGGAEVGILVNEWNHACCASLNEAAGHLSYSTRGWHRLLWEAGIPVDFVELSFASEDELAKYKALVLPVPLSISEEFAGKLTRYVQGGGHLISEAAPGRLDEHAFANRGELSPILAELFGVRHCSIQMVCEPAKAARWMPIQRTWGEFLPAAVLEGVAELAGQSVRANVYIETYTCQDSQPILTYQGAAAGTVRRVGEGAAWLLGTYLGHSGTAYCDERSVRLVRSLLAQCGVKPPHAGRLVVRRRVIPGKTALLLSNLTPDEITETIETGAAQVEDLLGEPFERQEGRVTLTAQSLDVRVLILTG
jgi:beta-galactosidase GanA